MGKVEWEVYITNSHQYDGCFFVSDSYSIRTFGNIKTEKHELGTTFIFETSG